MLIQLYIEALLVDEQLADQVWDERALNDTAACIARMLIVICPKDQYRGGFGAGEGNRTLILSLGS